MWIVATDELDGYVLVCGASNFGTRWKSGRINEVI